MSNTSNHLLRDKINGIFGGFLFPLIGYFLYYLFAYSKQMSIESYISYTTTPFKLPKILLLCLICNMAILLFMSSKKRDSYCKGIQISMFIYALLIIYVKFF